MAARLLATGKLGNVDEGTESLLLMGSVGDKVAGEYLSYVQNLDLPDPEELLAHPESYTVPKRQDQTFAILGQVVAHAIQNLTDARNQAAWSILAKTAKDGSVDLAASHARSLATAAVKNPKLKDYRQHIKPFIPLLQNAGLIPK
jgi:hypothetical protein